MCVWAGRRGAEGRGGPARRVGWGGGAPVGCRAGVLREPQRVPSSAGGGGQAESPRCGEGRRGCVSRGTSIFAPLSWGDGAGAPGRTAGALGPGLCSMLLRRGCVRLRARAGAAQGSACALPGLRQLRGNPRPSPPPHPTPTRTPKGPSHPSPAGLLRALRPCLSPVGRSVPLTCPAASRPRALASRSPAGAAAFIAARSTRAAAHSCGRAPTH